jgi:hypothetical protein
VEQVKVSRGIKPFFPMGIGSADTSRQPIMKDCMDNSRLLLNNPARQSYHYNSVPIEAAKNCLVIAGLYISVFNIPQHSFVTVQVALLGVSNINVQDGEGSSALHVATEGKKAEFWMSF